MRTGFRASSRRLLEGPLAEFVVWMSYAPASLQLNLFLVENLGFRPFLAPGALATLRAETGELALGPALRVGFENRGVGGDWFRAEIGAAYTFGAGPGPWVPILAVARGFSPFP